MILFEIIRIDSPEYLYCEVLIFGSTLENAQAYYTYMRLFCTPHKALLTYIHVTIFLMKTRQ